MMRPYQPAGAAASFCGYGVNPFRGQNLHTRNASDGQTRRDIPYGIIRFPHQNEATAKTLRWCRPARRIFYASLRYAVPSSIAGRRICVVRGAETPAIVARRGPRTGDGGLDAPPYAGGVAGGHRMVGSCDRIDVSLAPDDPIGDCSALSADGRHVHAPRNSTPCRLSSRTHPLRSYTRRAVHHQEPRHHLGRSRDRWNGPRAGQSSTNVTHTIRPSRIAARIVGAVGVSGSISGRRPATELRTDRPGVLRDASPAAEQVEESS